MKRLKYISINVRLGVAGSFPLNEDRLQFHAKVLQLIHGKDIDLLRLGILHTSPFDYQRIDSDTGYMHGLVQAAIAEATANRSGKFDLLLVDFSNNSFGLLRDPILMQLAGVFEEQCTSRACSNFVLLLPESPASETASMQQFAATAQKLAHYKLVITANDGTHVLFPKKGWKISALRDRYIKLRKNFEDDAFTRFENKIVRRLGHFKRARHGGGCRLYSYTSDNCETELQELIENWWAKKEDRPDAIVYDSRSNRSLITAIKAFAESKGLRFYRVQDLFSIQSEATKATAHSSCVLFLDVIETGNTLLSHATKLSQLNIKIDQEVIAAISKGTNTITRIGEYVVASFCSRDREPETTECVQCRLALPFSNDDEESFVGLRAFDMWQMAWEVGWESEQQVPDNVGEGYELVPRYPDLVGRYGDWIAYKMEKLYQRLSYPNNIFAIHPDEPGANAISEKLQLRFKNKLSVVKVPRGVIKEAQSLKNSWANIVEREKDQVWIKQLESLSNASAFITDIFNASGSTFQSLYELLKFYGISVFCYFPFVDRDCGPANSAKYKVSKYTLYSWYGPRQLRIRR
ncbi:MAG: hypothetical protein ACMG6H_10715 [Acidobacteriota bacterium]